MMISKRLLTTAQRLNYGTTFNNIKRTNITIKFKINDIIKFRSLQSSTISLNNKEEDLISTKLAKNGPILTPKIQNDKKFDIKPYLELARVDKPIGTMLLLWPCIWSISMASYSGNIPISTMLYTTGLFSAGAFIMRGAGCTINDLWDVKYDKKVERTKTRPIASGKITRFQAMKFLGIQLSAGLGILLQLNMNSIVLGASSLALVVVYPLMKRITYWPQFTLGLAFNWGALLGWCAINNSLDWNIVLPLYFSGVSWTLVYDTIYAHQDKKDDIKVGVKSTALFMGDQTKYYLTGFSTLTMTLLTLAGYLNGQGIIYFLGTLVGGSSHLFWQIKTVNLNNTKECWEKFASNNQFGAIIATSIIADWTWLTYLG